MDNIFLLEVILSFLVGGSYIAFSILVAEKFGPKWGGILLSLPSTSFMGLLFIGIVQGSYTVVKAAPILPIIGAVASLLIVLFIELYRFGMLKALFGAIVVWFLLTLPLVFYGFNDILIATVVGLVIIAAVWIYLKRIVVGSKAIFQFKFEHFLLRAFFSGLIIAIAVLMAKSLGPLWGGLFAGFPATTISYLVLLTKEYGIDFTKSVCKTTPIGNMGYLAFILSVFYLVPVYGVILGIVMAYGISAIVAFIVAQLAGRSLS